MARDWSRSQVVNILVSSVTGTCQACGQLAWASPKPVAANLLLGYQPERSEDTHTKSEDRDQLCEPNGAKGLLPGGWIAVFVGHWTIITGGFDLASWEGADEQDDGLASRSRE
jgi:hypothetical protein